MTQKDNAFGLRDFVDGFLFSLQADGRAPRTQDYYRKLLKHFLQYADTQAWPSRVDFIDTDKVRYFLAWVGSRSFMYAAGNGSQRPVKSKPSVAWPYFKALRRLFNWGIEAGLVRENPVKAIHFKRPRAAPVQPYCTDELKRFLTVCDFDIKTGARFTGLRIKLCC